MAEPPGGARTAGLLGLYLISGAASLIYEVSWSRLFTLHLGGLVPALAALLAAFLGGLAAGAWIGGRWAPRARRPLLWFAGLEAATALLAGLVAPGLDWLEPWFRSLYGAYLSAGGSFVVPSAATAALLVLPPAILMGATLPLLVSHLGGDRAGATAGRLYAANTVGAVAGTLAAGLWLLPALGLRQTLAVAGAGNLAAAALALALDEGGVRRRAGAEAPDRDGRRWPVPLGLFLAGAASMALQIGWTRALALGLGSSTYAFTIILAAFLTGLAGGGAAGAWWAGRAASAARALARAEAAAGASALGSIAVLGKLPLWLVPPMAGLEPGLGPLIAVQGAAAGAVVLLPTFFLGAAFPLAVQAQAQAGRSPARAAGEVQGAGSAGVVAGALLAALLMPALGLRSLLLSAALALPLAGLVMVLASPEHRRRGPGEAAAAVGLLSVAGLALPAWSPEVLTSGPFLYASIYQAGGDPAAAMAGRGRLLLLREGSAATVTVREGAGGIRSLQINGKTDASTGGDMVTQLLAGHLPALLAPDEPSRALVIGLASGVSLGALERYPWRRIDCVELIPEVTEAAALFGTASGGALMDPRLRLIVGDGRSHLLYADSRYDLITSQPTNPWVAGTAALYTRETFAAARGALREGGVFSQWIQGYALQPEDLRSVVATFLDVFPGATLWEESPAGGDYFLLGRRGDRAGEIDMARMEARLRRPAVRADLARAGIAGSADLLAHFVAGPEALTAYVRGAPLQRDDLLALEFTAPRALHADTLPDQVRALRRHRHSPAGLLRRLEPGRAAPLLAALRRARADARRDERLLLSIPRDPSAAGATPELTLGLELMQAGLTGPAEPHLRRAAERSPQRAEPRALLGALYLAAGRPLAARRELTEAVRLRPEDLSSTAMLARLELEAGSVTPARRRLRQAVASSPEDADLRNLAGAAALLDGDPEAGARELAAAVSLDPEMVEAWVNLGVARRRTGDRNGAREAYRRALRIEPENVDARYNLATALLAGEDAGGAAPLLESLVREDPTDVEARLLLGRTLALLDRPDEARAQLRAVLELAPGSDAGRRARRHLEKLAGDA